MNREEFVEKYYEFAGRAIAFAEKARREGLLSLEDDCDPEKIRTRDIFEYGLRFVVDGIDSELINKVLSNIIEQDTDTYSRRFKTIQKEAVLMMQAGTNSQMMYAVLNSFTDLPLEENEIG